jgi:hypothetical protein
VVYALSLSDLFWGIDAYVDPYSVEVKKIKYISFCFKSELDEPEEDEEENEDRDWIIIAEKSQFEMDIHMYEMFSIKEGWYNPEFEKHKIV